MADDETTLHRLRTPVLDIAYHEFGPASGEAVVLLHGFPYDPRCYDQMAARVAARGYRVIVPYLRGYGPTRFLSDDTPRSGQQGALAADLRDLLDGLAIGRAALVGYDWGGRAACIAAALWPERVRALVTGDGYNIQDIKGFAQPLAPEDEYRFWYQYYFHTPRGQAGLTAHRAAFCELLWRLWSPSWDFDPQTFARTAVSFENPDFVAVVIQSYRHRYGYAEGDPAYDAIEARLAAQPAIGVPTISLCGADDGVGPPPARDPDRSHFTGPYERRLLPGIGHNIPQEAPEETTRALFDLLEGERSSL
ncbi:alpha/beta hydrolase [Rhodospirillum rubrum]|uniref:alpha/beta fold hydrolase n=1 Tax=Rhodospirillum rubrum TaxID=1085 RepID=UPI001907A312|nr:alpha/beta hydrolase [Rhodospirillum rubrum]MBK1665327.1 alpha/beta hydrolase [Rhodospirillum rubrum]MBK1676515.1 alpha/beta hydrolase [Rhodospirillum rubrum]